MELMYQADNSNRIAVFSDGLRFLSGFGNRIAREGFFAIMAFQPRLTIM